MRWHHLTYLPLLPSLAIILCMLSHRWFGWPLVGSAKPSLHWAGHSADKLLPIQGTAGEEICQDLWCTANSSRGGPVDHQPPAAVLPSSISDLPFGYIDR